MVLSRFLGGFISRNKIYCLYHTGLGIKEICFCLFCCSSGKLISEKTQKNSTKSLNQLLQSRTIVTRYLILPWIFVLKSIFFFLFKYPRKGIDFSDVMRSFSLLVPNSRWLWFIISECVCVWRQVTQNTRSGSQSPLFNFRRLVSAVCPPLFYSGKKKPGEPTSQPSFNIKRK